MATVNEELQDAMLRHATYIDRYGATLARRMVALLDRADADLLRRIQNRAERLTAGQRPADSLRALLDEIRVLNRAAYEKAGKALTKELRDLAKYEAGWTLNTMTGNLPGQVAFGGVNTATVAAAAVKQPFEGATIREMLDTISRSKITAVREALRLGIVEGDTAGQLVTRLRGTRAMGYADGILNKARRDIETIVLTATQHVSSAAREQLYKENTDVVDKEQWVATLDGDTCVVCAGLDNQVFPVGSGPRTPRHPRCRCIRVPVTKSWRALGLDLDETRSDVRASQQGEVPKSYKYDDWLRKQPKDYQDDILGPTRAVLFRKGELPLKKFSNRQGDSLTIEQLRRAQPEAFKRAGL